MTALAKLEMAGTLDLLFCFRKRVILAAKKNKIETEREVNDLRNTDTLADSES